MIQREAVQEIVQRKNLMIAASYSNPNWDDPDLKDERVKYLDGLETHFNKAIEEIYKSDEEREAEKKAQEIDWDNPFWAASKRARSKMKVPDPVGDKSVEDVVNEEQQQRERRAKMRQATDQGRS